VNKESEKMWKRYWTILRYHPDIFLQKREGGGGPKPVSIVQAWGARWTSGGALQEAIWATVTNSTKQRYFFPVTLELRFSGNLLQ